MMFSISYSVLALFGCTLAFWRLPCDGPLTISRIDPIVTPGAAAGHVHLVVGASNTGLTTSFEELRASKCSTCKVKQDLSLYWVPNLYYHLENGSYQFVPPTGGILVYYLQRHEPGEKIVAFPDGFRMVAGDPSKRDYKGTLEQRAVSYACLGIPGPETPYFPKQYCPNGVRAQVFFPSCWDGKNLDSPDHKSHVAYPDRVDNGVCPPTHPIRFISLFYEVHYQTARFPFRATNTSDQPFIWSTGDDTGYSHHGDFFNGWDRDVLQTAIDTCTDNSGVVERCQVFEMRPNGYERGCTPEKPVWQEEVNIFGVLNEFPGVAKVNKVGDSNNNENQKQNSSPVMNASDSQNAVIVGVAVMGSLLVVAGAAIAIVMHLRWRKSHPKVRLNTSSENLRQ